LIFFQNFNEVYLKYAQIINNLHDEYYEHPKQSDVEHYVKGLIEKYHVHGFPLEAKEFEMRIHQFINYSNINNRSKVFNINYSLFLIFIKMSFNVL